MSLSLGKLALLYVLSIVVFIIIDSVWLGKIAPKLYRDSIGHLMADKPNLIAAAIFYAIFIAGLLLFVVLPAIDKGSLSHAIFYGFAFGLVTYATFDLTNQAVLKDWPTQITIIDLAWGSVLSSLCSAAVFLLFQRFLG